MNIDEIIKNRRATPPRFLAKKEVDKAFILKLLENANWAPNHKSTEPWRFQIFQGESKANLAASVFSTLEEIHSRGKEINMQKASKFRDNLLHVPVAIAVVMERDAAERIPEWEEVAAVSMAVQNMWLTATAMDFGAFWATPPFLPFLHQTLGLTPGQKLLGFFFVGHIAMDYPSPGRGDVAAKVEWK
ncbi:Nitroreductase [Mariniphaga anaerophila]|uniref:Putative NAD(P)H nitroreductase n=1 Tax=Mariniphaga anaerophila TaxID=1484053 RepID=A0A1M4XS26_9BACT|nr:nitroreductase [Mariniphaga anaerophila]SHE96367.1 Nitroreductase [Mariniphaga anaerophila]